MVQTFAVLGWGRSSWKCLLNVTCPTTAWYMDYELQNRASGGRGAPGVHHCVQYPDSIVSSSSHIGDPYTDKYGVPSLWIVWNDVWTFSFDHHYILHYWQHSDSSLYQLDVSYVFLFMMILCRLDVRILPWHPRIIWRHDGRRPQHAPPLPPPHTRYLWRQVPSFSNSDLWVWLWLWYADSHAS